MYPNPLAFEVYKFCKQQYEPANKRRYCHAKHNTIRVELGLQTIREYRSNANNLE